MCKENVAVRGCWVAISPPTVHFLLVWPLMNGKKINVNPPLIRHTRNLRRSVTMRTLWEEDFLIYSSALQLCHNRFTEKKTFFTLKHYASRNFEGKILRFLHLEAFLCLHKNWYVFFFSISDHCAFLIDFFQTNYQIFFSNFSQVNYIFKRWLTSFSRGIGIKTIDGSR